ncbi:MAG: hypothetical protein ACJ8FS_16430 [Sphingomicrobium sp.]
MLVFIKLAQPVGDKTHGYSHIECDVEGCGVRSPTSSELLEKNTSLFAMKWFIDGGHHRCPQHYGDETSARGPQYRDA